MRKYMLKRLFMMCFGVLLMGVSIALFNKATFGNDPFTCMNMGVSGAIGMTFGTLQLIVNCVLFVLVLVFARHLIGIGTIVNMVCVGFLADFFTPLLQFDISQNVILRGLFLLIGVVLLSIAAAFYFTANLGVAPYDALGFILTEKTKIHFRWCRIISDVIVTLIGLICGAIVGIGTLVTAFFMGPLISFFREKMAEPFLERGITKE